MQALERGSAVTLALGRRRRADEAFERAGEVALVGEAGRQRQVGERSVALEHLLAGPVDAAPPHELAGGAAVVPAKRRDQVTRMDASLPRQVVEAGRVG